MARLRIWQGVIASAVLCSVAAACSQEEIEGQLVEAQDPDDLATVAAAIVVEARSIIDTHGASEEGLQQVQQLLANLAAEHDFISRADMGSLHGSSAMGAQMLASEGTEGISLYLVRFTGGTETAIHDHLTWGVIHVLDGDDRLLEWEPTEAGPLDQRADMELAPGQGSYWLPPPGDVHSQIAATDDVWELVMTGRDVTHPNVTDHRHYYDPATGAASNSPPG